MRPGDVRESLSPAVGLSTACQRAARQNLEKTRRSNPPRPEEREEMCASGESPND